MFVLLILVELINTGERYLFVLLIVELINTGERYLLYLKIVELINTGERYSGEIPGFQVRGDTLKKSPRAEGGAKIFGYFV